MWVWKSVEDFSTHLELLPNFIVNYRYFSSQHFNFSCFRDRFRTLQSFMEHRQPKEQQLQQRKIASLYQRVLDSEMEGAFHLHPQKNFSLPKQRLRDIMAWCAIAKPCSCITQNIMLLCISDLWYAHRTKFTQGLCWLSQFAPPCAHARVNLASTLWSVHTDPQIHTCTNMITAAIQF